MAVPEDTGYPLKWFIQQEFVRSTFECVICLEVVNDPVQVCDCGHQFCRYCLDGVFRSQQHPRCPSCQRDISEEMVFTDNGIKRVIDNQEVNCPNTGCEWNGQLSSLLKEHVEICPFLILSCSNNGCDVQVIRKDLEGHLTECEHRIVVCQYCNDEHVFKDKAEHLETCPYLPVECTNKCSEKDIPRNQMPEHLEKVCLKTVIKCKYLDFGCTYECERREMEEHLNQEMKDHLELSTLEMSRLKDQHQKDIDVLRQENEEIAAVHQKDMEKLRQEIAAVKVSQISAVIITDFNRKLSVANLELELSTLEISRLKDQHQKDIDKLRQENEEIAAVHQKDMEKLRQEIAAVHQKDMEKLRQEIAAVKVSQTAVIITDFNRKLSEAKDSNTLGKIYGDPFLTSPLGYKIKMEVLLNETREAYKDHMGVYIRLMKTDHDAMLSWPFKKKNTFTLIDQQDNEQERKNIVTTMTPAGQDEFKRPKDEENKAQGFGKFVSHATLRTRKYIKDDTVCITVDIEP